MHAAVYLHKYCYVVSVSTGDCAGYPGQCLIILCRSFSFHAFVLGCVARLLEQ